MYVGKTSEGFGIWMVKLFYAPEEDSSMLFKMDRTPGRSCPKFIQRRVTENDVWDKDEIRSKNISLLNLKGSAILEHSLCNRRRAVKEILTERNAAHEEEQTVMEELKKDEEMISNLALENNKKQREGEAKQKKLDAAKQMKHLTKERAKMEKQQDDIEKLKSDIKEITEDYELYMTLQDEIGVYHGGRVEEDLVLVVFTKIHPTYPADQYYLFFTKFPADFAFEVHHAEPTFSEFNDLVEEFKGSKDLREFYHRVCEYWKRDARAGGTPRLATPGARVSIGTRNCQT